MNYDVDYFIKKFEAIPEEKWCVSSFRYNGASCANGHLGMRAIFFGSEMPEKVVAFQKIFADSILHDIYGGLVKDISCYSQKAAFINNGETKEYQQKNPKQRILAALYDVKKLQEETKEPEVKIDYSQSVPVTFEKIVKEIPVYSN